MEELNKRVLESPKRVRRTHSKEFKAKLVSLAKSGEVSVAQLAMDHRLNANQLRKWIKESEQQPKNSRMVPVVVEQSKQQPASLSTPVMEISLSGALIRFHHAWDPEAVAVLIKAVR